MKQFLIFKSLLVLSILLVACNSADDDSKKNVKKEKLVELRDGKYTEWYPGKKQIKFQIVNVKYSE